MFGIRRVTSSTMALWWRMLLLLVILLVNTGKCLRCDRTPEGVVTPRSRANDRYVIEVSGNPSTYVPGEQYTIFLRSNPDYQTQSKFKDFMLIVEHESSEKIINELNSPTVGSLQLYGDMLTKFSERCRNAVIQTNSLPKSEVQVLWLAPLTGSGCVAIRATVIESKDVWYSDDGKLSKILCEETEENEDTQPNVLRHCCACDEAKYEVTFEGLWSRNTHPKDFPSNGWLTRFSDIIGASHSVDYTFWNYGEIASEGLRELAENGNTRMLESELKEKSNHIRTIIKARGISYPNITGKTFAVFRVDSKHHLMSIVSMLDPSPDWIVGVSSLELCLRNCSWVESRVLNLYPWDAGTDDGVTYISPNQPSNPRDPIRRIKSNSPNDPRSPFYDSTGAEMKPLARLSLSRQRLYEKACDPSQKEDNEDYDNAGGNTSPDGNNANCQVSAWSDWSPCSASCGKGIKYKQRTYVHDESKYHCHRELTRRAPCTGVQRHCRTQSHVQENNPFCTLTDWGDWSSCSVTCGKGVKTRNRRYKNRSAAKRCAAGSENPLPLEQTIECDAGECSGDDEDAEDEDEGKDCSAGPWSEWSPCSASCGRGIKVRTRINIPKQFRRRYRFEDVRNYDGDDECPQEEKVECINDDDPVCIESDEIDPVVACSLPKDEGRCMSNVDRWYFDIIKSNCDIFSYSGCQGNKNNFKTLERCETVCGSFKRELNANRTAHKRQLGVSVSGVFSYAMQLQNDDTAPNMTRKEHCEQEQTITGISSGSHTIDDDNVIEQKPFGNVVDCRVSGWSKWSPCNVTCGKGFKTKYRTIKVHPINGGRRCPEKLIKNHRCVVQCNNNNDDDGNLNPTWGHSASNDNINTDCVMTKWSAWSPCSRSCGQNAVQQRTRSIVVPQSGRGQPCMHRTEQKSCPLLACPE